MDVSFSRYGLCIAAMISASLLSAESMLMNASDKTNQGEKVITPPTNPVVQHGFDFFVTADFIYWTARLDDIDYAETGITHANNIASTSEVENQGDTIGPHHKMSPGFKVGVGINLGHDGWDSYVQYTWLHNSASSQDTFSLGIRATWQYAAGALFNADSSEIQAATSEWHLHFNTVDWELGREFFISSHLILRPHFGLKGSWQKQTYSVHQTNISDNSETHQGSLVFDQVGHGSYNMDQKQSYWGLGIRAGLNTAWHFTRNWSIFGDCAVAPLWSQFTVSRVDLTTSSSSYNNRPIQMGTIVANQSNRLHSLRTVLELDIGFRWDYWFLDDRYRMRIQGAWEEQLWFGQNEFIDATHPTYGSLSLQGFTAAFRFDF